MAVFYSQPLPSSSSLDDTLRWCCGYIAARSRATPLRDGERYWISHWLTVIYISTHTHTAGIQQGFLQLVVLWLYIKYIYIFIMYIIHGYVILLVRLALIKSTSPTRENSISHIIYIYLLYFIVEYANVWIPYIVC